MGGLPSLLCYILNSNYDSPIIPRLMIGFPPGTQIEKDLPTHRVLSLPFLGLNTPKGIDSHSANNSFISAIVHDLYHIIFISFLPPKIREAGEIFAQILREEVNEKITKEELEKLDDIGKKVLLKLAFKCFDFDLALNITMQYNGKIIEKQVKKSNAPSRRTAVYLLGQKSFELCNELLGTFVTNGNSIELSFRKAFDKFVNYLVAILELGGTSRLQTILKRVQNETRLADNPYKECICKALSFDHKKIQKKITPLLDAATKQHRAINFEEDRQLYKKVLTQQPKNTGALHQLGVLCFQCGELDDARRYSQLATLYSPYYPAYYLSLGVVLQASGLVDVSSAMP